MNMRKFKPKLNMGIALLSALLIASIVTGCSGGAVVFAPTPAPLDSSPALYAHPSRAFTITVPRQWTLYEQNTTTLASAHFSAPNSDHPTVSVAAIKLDDATAARADTAALIDLYQGQVRPDIEQYREQTRTAMGDGSWRLTGLRSVAGGGVQQINTFLQQAGAILGVVDVILPTDADPAVWSQLQTLVNTFTLAQDADLESAPLTTLAFAKEASLAILHVTAWNTATGVFFITGEVANYGANTITDLPIEAALFTAQGLQVEGAVDVIMGHGITPGGFAPFSLRFGAGQPSLATQYRLTLGAEWSPASEGASVAPAGVISSPVLTWTDEASFDSFNRLVISGTVTNSSSQVVRQPRALATLFDGAQNVVGAAWVALEVPEIAPGASAPFAITLPEYASLPQNYIITIQGLPPDS